MTNVAIVRASSAVPKPPSFLDRALLPLRGNRASPERPTRRFPVRRNPPFACSTGGNDGQPPPQIPLAPRLGSVTACLRARCGAGPASAGSLQGELSPRCSRRSRRFGPGGALDEDRRLPVRPATRARLANLSCIGVNGSPARWRRSLSLSRRARSVRVRSFGAVTRRRAQTSC